MKRLLIANRGEIAVRIIRACREYGISPVVVYSEADRDLPFVALADTSVCIGPGPATESYLRGDRILEAAQVLGADAIHPGYGFLSENPDFSDACAEAGITFVGPTGDAIRRLGDKSAAKRLVSAAGVPVVPGYNGDDQTDARLATEADGMGLPLIIKAVAGGGGRGMRLVRERDDFLPSLNEARREATNAFKDDRVLLEQYIERPRHIEFQIFADTYGNVVHLGERECSIQRRHQKIIEESPAPGLSAEIRTRMGEAAVAAARAAGYIGAGTVEFLLEESDSGERRFYFLEVNTRLQVEHPVTETVTGQDLVRWQFLVAEGHPLPLTQAQIAFSSAAIEVRIYAEDPSTGFLPSVGTITHFRQPAGAGIRVDSGYEAGNVVPPYYDPMLAKLIVQGASRPEALARLTRALTEFEILGVRTNIAYLRAIIQHPEFQAGHTTTGFLAEHFTGWHPDTALPVEGLLALAADSILPRADTHNTTAPHTRRPVTPWEVADSWRNVK